MQLSCNYRFAMAHSHKHTPASQLSTPDQIDPLLRSAWTRVGGVALIGGLMWTVLAWAMNGN